MSLKKMGVEAVVEGIGTYLNDMNRLGKATGDAADQTEKAAKHSEGLSKALSGVGKVVAGLGLAGLFGAMIKEASESEQKVAELNAVQNTYLQTFQILGGLGLLLGSAGLGVVVLRNVLADIYGDRGSDQRIERKHDHSHHPVERSCSRRLHLRRRSPFRSRWVSSTPFTTIEFVSSVWKQQALE